MSEERKTLEIQAEADRWLVRWYSGADQESLKPLLDAWLSADPNHARAFRDAENLWQQIGQLGQYPPFQATLHVRSGSANNIERRLRFKPLIAMGLAASLLMIGIGLPWLKIHMTADYLTTTGEMKRLTLADGTQLHLNTQSAVAINYNSAEREVRLLKGEVEFVVIKDTQRPFVVKVGEESIKALGTDFIVRCDQDQLTVTQLESRVEMTHPHTSQAVVLNPGEQIRHQHGQPFEAKQLVDTQKVSAWRRGKLVFESTPLATVVAEINRYRSGQILLLGDKPAALTVSGVFDLQHLEKLIGAIEHTLAVKTLAIDGQLIVIY